MTWQEYTDSVHKLVKAFGGGLYAKANIDKGWAMWKHLDKQKLDQLIGISLFEGRPMDLYQVGLTHQPKREVQYYKHTEIEVNRDSLNELKKQHGANSLWDLVLKFKGVDDNNRGS